VSAGARLAGFLVGLAAIALVGFGLGRLLDVSAPGGESGATAMDAHMGGEAAGGHGGGAAHGDGGGHGAMQMSAVRGLGVAENGLRLAVADPEFARGASERLRFRIVDAADRPVTDFDLAHTKRMHVIVVRRDLTGFQHLHPEMAADGTWSVPLRLTDPGTYRVFADFSVEGEAVTLADDLRIDGDADLRDLPAPASRALSVPGDYEVELGSVDGHAGAHAGEETSLRFAISRGGEPAVLQPYLGAGGHLVALREGDLAFLHVHPTGDAGKDGSIEFEATFPTAGNYRLFLQFKVGGELQTVAFTEEVH
jgi:hypothetical protein